MCAGQRRHGSSVGRIKARDDSEQGAEEKVRYIAANPPIEQTGSIISIGRIDKEEYRRNVSISYEIEDACRNPPQGRERLRKS